MRQCGEVIRLVGLLPFDPDAGATGEFRMNCHDGTAVAIQKGVSIGQCTHHLSRLVRHEGLILALPQTVLGRHLHITRIGKHFAACLGDGDIRRVFAPVLASPRIDVAEQCL